MWHVSISHQHPRRGVLGSPELLERNAVAALAGVGGLVEWWMYSPGRIGHLRVALTVDESAVLPPYCGPIDDAGDAGPMRPRSKSSPEIVLTSRHTE